MSTMPFNDVAARRMARLAGLSYVLYSAAGIYITFGPIPSLSALGDENASPLLALMFRTGVSDMRDMIEGDVRFDAQFGMEI